MQLLTKILGDPNQRELKRIQPIIDRINALEPEIQKLSDEELAGKTAEFRAQLALYLKGGRVLEDELLKLFREAVTNVEPLAERCSDEQLRAAITDYRQKLDRRRDEEEVLRDQLADVLDELFAAGYERLNPTFNALRVEAVMDLVEERQLWPEEAPNPEEAIMGLLQEVEPDLAQLPEEERRRAFAKAWAIFEEERRQARNPDEEADERLERLLSRILTHLQPELVAYKAEAMQSLSEDMARRYRQKGKTLDDLLPEAFAVVREVARRVLNMRHFDVQLIGGVVLHQGKIAEMKTGEGKTLVATLPVYLNALTGKGVHVVTVNDYLARRDAEWMGKIYRFLGMSVGVIVNAVEPQSPERRAAYAADITYGTNNEFGFDYLRDNMVTDLSQLVQRELNYAIVDEVDNILIDEARTPLIISGPGPESTDLYVKFARLVPRLKPEIDYTVDEKSRTVMLTDEGIEKMERMLGTQNLYAEEHLDLARYMENALKAHVLFKRDRDYLVKDGQVIIVDEFTGRLLPGRRYSEGLHQAIEAKEGVQVQRENHTYATITFQNYFRLYRKLAGMTGTAITEAEEFHKIYKLDVIVIPPNKPMIRQDLPDLIYRTEEAKWRAVVREIKERHERGQPVLVGTTSVEKSEHLSHLLSLEGIPHNVLNAKHHEREAQIIAQAGRSGAVTIATNMAGRGTDILLGGNPASYFDLVLRKHAENVDYIREMPENTPEEREEKEEAIRQYIEGMTEEEKNEILQDLIRQCEEDHQRVVELGGLHVIGTERHESRRIDNQLRGRAGRQGDPGSSRFYLSLEDDLMRRFGADRASNFMKMAGMDDDTPLESSLVSRFIEQTQARVEGYNFDIRKHVVEYDDVIAKQREVIYADRRAVLERADMHERVLEMIRNEIAALVDRCIPGQAINDEGELELLFTQIERWVHVPEDFLPENLHALRKDELKERLSELVIEHYEAQGRRLAELAEEHLGQGVPTLGDLERSITLQVVDRLWMDHIDALDVMRSGIQFRAVGQRDPLTEFKNEAYRMFEELKRAIQHYIVDELLKMLRGEITVTVQRPQPKPRQLPRNLRTNVDEIARLSGQAKSDGNGTRPRSSGGRRAARGGTAVASPPVTQPAVPPRKIGRNDLCYCGSGKKYKKCHGA
ncbi:protein translocase subunit SecA [Thermogemmatispora aurantia]|uniref:Protein translocase subunit SecA n=1 Tax=Thermogemmatispora aurantia TaxID=2045279 RepID=A0A5J4K8G8_9CHLR|nr:preprotein translocase subunit SecA [Thermogemmatispora aurantia]GER83382.1 protein translocase subunit SecA [Thermogemmatispora aurantia]